MTGKEIKLKNILKKINEGLTEDREGRKKRKKKSRGIEEVRTRERESVCCSPYSLSHHPVCSGLGRRLLSCVLPTDFYFGRDLMIVICHNFFFFFIQDPAGHYAEVQGQVCVSLCVSPLAVCLPVLFVCLLCFQRFRCRMFQLLCCFISD